MAKRVGKLCKSLDPVIPLPPETAGPEEREVFWARIRERADAYHRTAMQRQNGTR